MSNYGYDLDDEPLGYPPAPSRNLHGLRGFQPHRPVTHDPDPAARQARAVERARRRLEAEEARLATIEARPFDTHPDYTVLRFTKPGRFAGSPTTMLTYAAIKAGEADGRPRWFLTGQPTQGKTWPALLDFIGDDNLDTIEVAVFPPEVSRYTPLGLVEAWVAWRKAAGSDPYDRRAVLALEYWQCNPRNWAHAVRGWENHGPLPAVPLQSTIDQATAVIKERADYYAKRGKFANRSV